MNKKISFCLLLSLFVVACGGGGSDSSPAVTPPAPVTTTPPATEQPTDGIDGEEVYRLPQADGNVFACVNCHALKEPAENGFARAGHAIGNATRRASFKNGQFDTFLEAANTCLEDWMNAEPWTEDSETYLALNEYLENQADETNPEQVEIQIVQPPAELTGGDIDRGQEHFNTSCAMCHGENGTGSNLAPGLFTNTLTPEYIARRVRLSGPAEDSVYPDLTGGIMPFWGANRLADSDLLDLVAYISNGETTPANPDNSQGEEIPDRVCSTTHDKVGQVADLITQFHDVSGTATIVDDCTIEFTNFNFDGGGIVVEVYGGFAGDYHPPTGFSMSPNLVGPPFVNDNMTVQLPEGKTLDDLTGVSIWCVDVGLSFGDGMFR